ncbi:MAG: protein adenylyltransferase SelO [Hyphomicrobiaceae bacterium]
MAATVAGVGTRPIPFDNSYARLPDRFFTRTRPTPVARPGLVKINTALARELGIDAGWLASPDGVAALAGNATPEGAEPIAAAYAGHQFGGFSPQLGDGRAILLGEVVTRQGRRFDIQLKGSGPTPFSRRGDGRAALGPVLREYIVAEAMHALGVPTTRALAAVTTGEYVLREGPLPGAVLARVAESHIRVGTFQYFAARGDVDAVRALADHAIARHCPEISAASNPYLALLRVVIARQARLVAKWMHIGFIHGVMNTDNMAISGETIDYGPCAFMDDYHPDTVYSSIDRQGRYAFANQPSIAQWNLARLAEALLPLIAPDEKEAVRIATEAVEEFTVPFAAAYAEGLARKLGIVQPRRADVELAGALLSLMMAAKADHTNSFRMLSDAEVSDLARARLREALGNSQDFDDWDTRWRQRLAEEATTPEARRVVMRAANPWVIPRNHRIEEVITAAVANGDYQPFEELIDVLARPFDEQPGREDFTRPPRPDQVVEATFCGT